MRPGRAPVASSRPGTTARLAPAPGLLEAPSQRPGTDTRGPRKGRQMSTNEAAARPATIRSTIPARLDRLKWSPFHTRMVAGLGAAWILDGLQITISSSVTGELTKPSTLGMSSTEIGLIASIYLVGEVVGALVFGKLSD